MAVSHFSNHPGVYTAHLFVIAGTCKWENEFLQHEVLETARLALTNAQDQLGGCLYCITSDGDIWPLPKSHSSMTLLWTALYVVNSVTYVSSTIRLGLTMSRVMSNTSISSNSFVTLLYNPKALWSVAAWSISQFIGNISQQLTMQSTTSTQSSIPAISKT